MTDADYHNPSKAAEPAKSILTPELRRKLNANLVEDGLHGFTCGLSIPPGGGKPQIVKFRLPRSGSGHPPRGGVQIPVPPISQMAFQRESKHARQDHRHGQTGNKGKRTIAFKRWFLSAVAAIAVQMAVSRKKFRAKFADRIRQGIASSAYRFFGASNAEAYA